MKNKNDLVQEWNKKTAHDFRSAEIPVRLSRIYREYKNLSKSVSDRPFA